jgi:hypothetical protein
LELNRTRLDLSFVNLDLRGVNCDQAVRGTCEVDRSSVSAGARIMNFSPLPPALEAGAIAGGPRMKNKDAKTPLRKIEFI